MVLNEGNKPLGAITPWAQILKGVFKMKLRKIVALLLAAVMCLGLFAACSAKPQSSTPLVVSSLAFSEKFSPFFADTSYDQDIAGLTQVSLLTTDRVGGIIYKGIEGETVAYNGTDYTYTGISDLTVDQNDDGSVDYTFKIRDDITFSDDEKLTADDIIFTMYVLSDPTYDGSSTLYSAPIKGMDAYRSGMQSRISLMIAAGEDNTDFTNWTQEDQTAFWTAMSAASEQFVQEIVDYCAAAGYAADSNDVTGALNAWGFENVKEGATLADGWKVMVDAYEGDILTLSSVESAGSTIPSLLFAEGSALDEDYYNAGVQTGESAANIEGIVKIDDTTVKVTTDSFDATAVYQLGISVAPLHYYGEKDKYDYDNNMFGFTKGDLSHVKSVTTTPMGAGPYKFVKYENKVVYFEANDNYFKGAPKTKNLQFKESTDADMISGIVTNTVDIATPSFSKDAADAIAKENSNGEISGDKIDTKLTAFLGYGYIGINASNVKVGDKADSDESKALRKALATVISVYRDMAIDSYYGEAAEVINYPISSTSWAAPQKSDSDYEVAFSKDVNGDDIYTEGMDDEAKYEAALNAALGYFEKAGYTVENGKLTAAPKGAKLEYELIIPGDGTGDHPSFAIVTAAKKAFESIGLNLIINDPSDSNVLWDALDVNKHELWCAAWGATIDPDMYQVYHSSNIAGLEGSSNSNHYHIQDEELDKNIMDARTSSDQSYRKSVYKACLDIIIDWAVEVPIYQRQECTVFSAERIKLDTVTPDITTFYGWAAEIENIEMA